MAIEKIFFDVLVGKLNRKIPATVTDGLANEIVEKQVLVPGLYLQSFNSFFTGAINNVSGNRVLYLFHSSFLL